RGRDAGAAMLEHRQSLLMALAALALVQAAHLLDVLRLYEQASFPTALDNPRALLGIAAAVVACVAVWRRWRIARLLALTVGVSVAVAFALYHGLPVQFGANHPYWGAHGHADAVQWLTVAAIVANG